MAKSRKGHKHVSGVLLFFLILLLLIAAALTGAVMSYSYVNTAQENIKNPRQITIPESQRLYIDIPNGSSTSKIADILHKEKLIEYPQIFKIMSKVNGYDGLYQSGTHIVSKQLGYEELMMVLVQKPEIIKIMLPEGLTVKQIYSQISKTALVHRNDIKDYIGKTEFDYTFLKGLPARPDRLEGYLFPDTYEFDLNATPAVIVERMLNNFANRIPDEYYERAEEIGMTMDQVITLASVIEREAKAEEDRFLISGVFHNRLASRDESMRRLQSCATIQYIFYQRNGIMLSKISDNDTKVVDPYNTYLHAGLPPGPICCPGLSSIKAALYPTSTDYMFFVAKGDGTHKFSLTYEEHLAAVKEYGLVLGS